MAKAIIDIQVSVRSVADVDSYRVPLEELGYLTQPHTSAGRAPTDLAYRLYVDMLPSRTKLRDAERRAIVTFFDEALADVDEILRGTTQLLSRLTRYASLAFAPSVGESSIVRSELIGLGSATLLLVVFGTGRVEKRVIEAPPGASEDVLERVSRTMMQAFRGKTLGEARVEAEERTKVASGDERVLLERAGEALRSMEDAPDSEHVVMGGVSNIASEEGFNRRDTLRQVYEALERESAMLGLLREADAISPVSVSIGHENPIPGMWEASVVAAPYAAGGGTVGTIGVVGPMRMDYAAAISAVRAVADRLSAAVEALRT